MRPVSWGERFQKLVFACILVYLLAMFAIQEVRLHRLRGQVGALKQRIAVVRQQNEALKERAELLRTPDFVERVAREELGLVKPGEIPYVEVPQEGPDHRGAGASTEGAKPLY